jgi:hypothetical protein
MEPMNSSRPRAAFGCSQQDLYTIVQVGWTSYMQYLPSFEAYSVQYDAARATTALAALDAARLMPDEWSRREVHKTLRLQLGSLANTALALWTSMSSYIREGFPRSEYENKRLAAGHAYYAEAVGRDWEKVNAVLSSGLVFLNGNTAALTAGGMPANFAADYAAARTAFMTKYGEFLQALEATRNMTDAKMVVNNGLHKELTAMFEDGKRIFRHDAAIRLEFTFDRILELITGNGGNNGGTPDPGPDPDPDTSVRIKGHVSSMMDGSPVAGAQVRAYSLSYGPDGPSINTTTDANGDYFILIQQLPETTEIVIEASADGFFNQQRNLTADPSGEYSDENFSLMPTG